jgi:enoyl reductase-like protein
MTPCTSARGVPLVAAATNAGFAAELAGGGLSRPAMFRAAIEELTRSLDPGHTIALNLM